MVFLWFGLHLTAEEHRQDPFESPVMIPCKNIECGLFRDEFPDLGGIGLGYGEFLKGVPD
jgi:hypothetical protein